MPDYVEVKLTDIKGNISKDLPTKDQFKAITVPDEMTLPGLIGLQRRTANRFTFTLHASGNMATCRWVDYIYNAAGTAILLWTVHDPENGKFLGSAQISEPQTKDVIVSHPTP